MKRLTTISWAILLLAAPFTQGFACSSRCTRRSGPSSPLSKKTTSLYEALSSSNNNNNNNHNDSNDTSFMTDLQRRIQIVRDNEHTLPLVVMEAVVPGQELRIHVQNRIFFDLVKHCVENETPYFGMLGIAKRRTGELVHLKQGVRVEFVDPPKIRLESTVLSLHLKATQRFELMDGVQDTIHGWTTGRVQFLDDSDDETQIDPNDRLMLARAMNKARKLDPLLETWMGLARRNERRPGQIDQLVSDLGPIPEPEEPTSRAFWVGGLINPTPSLGVALEIRPSLIRAKTPEERIDIVTEGVRHSIRTMQNRRLVS